MKRITSAVKRLLCKLFGHKLGELKPKGCAPVGHGCTRCWRFDECYVLDRSETPASWWLE